MKNYAFLFWAYTIVWLGIAGYLVYMMRKLRDVGTRVARLERAAQGGTIRSRNA